MYSGYHDIRKRNPRETCNVLSFLTFAYTIPLFKQGIKGNIQESDIYEVPKTCNSKRCGNNIETEWNQCKTLCQLLWRRFGTRYVCYTCIHLSWALIFNTFYPYAMSRFIAYFEKNQTLYSKKDAYYYGGIVIFISLFRCLWIYNYFMLECILGVQIRASLTSLIYRKVLRLRPEQVKGSSMGNIVTILTKDIRTIVTAMWPLSDLIVGWVQFMYLSYLLYSKIGIPSLIPIGILSFGIFGQAILSQFILKIRLRVGKMADRRLKFTREVLSVLKIIKMYTWEPFFHRRICEARKKETKANLRTWYLGHVIICFGTLVAKMTFPIFLLSYLSLGYSVNTELIYYVMSIFQELAFLVGITIPSGFCLRSEIYASILRIEKVLTLEESSDDTQKALIMKQNKVNEAKIDFQNVSITIENDTILRNICLTIEKPGLYVVTGPLGSGKSSILKAILEEYSVSKGQLAVCGTISYASQDPWLFPATVKQNVVFGKDFNRIKYEQVIKNSSLEYDLRNLPNGDNTIITDGGLNFSKGQQARINLARAVYRDSDIYLLDDPLSGLDVKVQENVFNNCIRKFLKDKIVVLVTQNSQHLKHAKEVIFIDHGAIKSILKSEDNGQNKVVNSVMPEFPEICQQEGANTQFSNSEELQGNIYHENKNIGKVDIKNYISYIKYGGGVLIFAIVIFVFFAAQFTESFSQKLLSKWVDYQQEELNKSMYSNHTRFDNSTNPNDDRTALTSSTFNLYITMIGVTTGIDLIKSYIFLAYCRRSSIKFHKIMCNSVINCVMPFLDNHFIGNILNRFSYDLDHVDEVFPFLFMDLIKSFFAIGGTIVLIVTVNWIFLFVSILFCITLAVVRMLYMPAARAIKRLCAITRSPFIGHLNATVSGISTVKAFKAELLLKDEFDKHQNLALSAEFMETTTARAFGYALSFISNIFISLIICTFLFMDTDSSVGNIGLALTQVFTLSQNLEQITRVWAELENCMTSVERVVEYTEIPQENKLGEILKNWPQSGKIVYHAVNLKYNFESEVLKNINFTIDPGEKVGIVGRTGAGKSSIISTLFRLYDYQGKIWIDDIDITAISLESLRRNLSIIPQDPITFEGSVRANIDPYQCYQDKDIWSILKKVKLETVIKNLDTNILDLTLSTGQKQLLCLARALLQNNKIVVMDEPTANLDLETDALVHNLIKEYFENCTIIMVAHRLNSVLKCDKVMVMDNGNMVEFENPRNLLANEHSLFYKMMNKVDRY